MDLKQTPGPEVFGLEAFMSKWEQRCELSAFAESGVHPLKLSELLSLLPDDARQAFLETRLDYPEVNGLRKLRTRIAALYGESDCDKVLVTVGASEANHLIANCILGPQDEIALLVPTYKQFVTSALNASSAKVREFYLDPNQGWKLDIGSLESAVSPTTKIIALVDPNNPTGRILSASEREHVVRCARKVGAWILADEVYAGAETSGDEETSSWYRMDYDKIICVNSLSKAYGAPGLRIGWAIGNRELIDRMWRVHECVAISAGVLGNCLASLILGPELRPKIIARSRRLIRNGWPLVERMQQNNAQLLDVVRPGASAMCFLKYNLKIPSVDLAERLAEEKGVLVVPGALCGMEHHLRLSYALPSQLLTQGLAHLVDLLKKIEQEEASV